MDIALYISTILQEQDELGVPGLGTFHKKKAAARFDPISKKFFPPGYQLSFTEGKTSNRSLINYISKTKNISESSADYFAEKYGNQIKNDLTASPTVQIGDLGVFHSGELGISFEPGAISFSPEGFGLTAVAEPDYIHGDDKLTDSNVVPEQITPHIPLAEEKPAVNLEDIPYDSLLLHDPFNSTASTSSEVSNADTTANNTVDPPTTHEASAESEFEEAPARRGWLIWTLALIAVAGLAVAGYFYRDQLNNLFQQAKAPVVKKIVPVTKTPTLSDSIMSADSIVEALRQQGLNAEKPLDTATISTKPELINEPGAVKSYDIIGPSFTKLKQAELYIKNMHAKGIYAYVVNLPGPRIKVALGSFKDEASAKLELPRIQKDVFPGAYVQPIKNPQK